MIFLQPLLQLYFAIMVAVGIICQCWKRLLWALQFHPVVFRNRVLFCAKLYPYEVKELTTSEDLNEKKI